MFIKKRITNVEHDHCLGILNLAFPTSAPAKFSAAADLYISGERPWRLLLENKIIVSKN